MKAEGNYVSNKLIKEKAKELKLATGYARFKASHMWLEGFKLRNNIGTRSHKKVVCINIDENRAKSPQQELEIEKLIGNECVNLQNLYNINEIILLWKALPTKTHVGNSKQSISGLKLNKERIMLVLCANASGTHKIKPLVVSNYQNPHALKEKDNLLLIHEQSKKTWKNTNLFTVWYENDFKSSTKSHQLQKGVSGKIYLLLDNCSDHKKVDAEDENFQIMHSPPDTSLIQPMTEGVIDKIKTCFRHKLMKEFLRYSNGEEEFYQKYSINDCINMVAESWEDILYTKNNIKNTWKEHVDEREEISEEKKDKEKHEENILNEMQDMMRIILERNTTMEDVIRFLTECRLEEIYFLNQNDEENTSDIYENDEENRLVIDESDDENKLVIIETDDQNRDEIHENEEENKDKSHENDEENRHVIDENDDENKLIITETDDQNRDEIYENEEENTDEIHENDEENRLVIDESDDENKLVIIETDDQNRDEIHENEEENKSKIHENDEGNRNKNNENRNDEIGTTDKGEKLTAADIKLNPEEREEMKYIFERLEYYYPRLPHAIKYYLQACKSACIGEPIDVKYSVH
ncbi:jerky protein homolog-like [Ceratina calcarata]|uniref:Jerky protein homolog-like n=1 Tax=Ceratina calcarata TaxID=156304 RepID=A0AAJ7N364_9HYME|nr:jerky protein homolog-like [Ceratina calcarata]